VPAAVVSDEPHAPSSSVAGVAALAAVAVANAQLLAAELELFRCFGFVVRGECV